MTRSMGAPPPGGPPTRALIRAKCAVIFSAAVGAAGALLPPPKSLVREPLTAFSALAARLAAVGPPSAGFDMLVFASTAVRKPLSGEVDPPRIPRIWKILAGDNGTTVTSLTMPSQA